MKLVHPILNQPINWNECLIQSFVIENPKMYREFVEELYQQMEGSKGNFVLSEDNELLDLSKYAELISDIIKINTDSKKIITGVIKDLTDIAINERHFEILELYRRINEEISNIIFSSGIDIVFDDINDISQILKLYNVKPNDEKTTLAERILFYMELCEKYLKKHLFIFFNLHSYFAKEELELLFKNIQYSKYNVFIVERYDFIASIMEQKRIIDIDLCEI